MIAHSRPSITTSDERAVLTQLQSDRLTQGSAVRDFEDELAAFQGRKHCIAVASGTAAFALGLVALGLPAGSEVVIPAYICESVAQAVRIAGLAPVFCDNGDRWMVSAESVAAAMRPRTSALLLFHPLGAALGAAPFVDLASKAGSVLIEDICHSFGAYAKGAYRVGNQSTFSFVSFHATKLLTTGEGGALFCDDSALADHARAIRDGEAASAAASWAGRFVAPMSDLNAALGRAQLARLPAMLERRLAIATRYFQELQGLPLQLPNDLADRSNFFRFPLLDPALSHGLTEATLAAESEKRFFSLRAKFETHGVQVRRGVDAVLSEDCPVAAHALAETVSIPIYPSLEESDVARVVDAVRKVYHAY
jgi:perosamine synthetase